MKESESKNLEQSDCIKEIRSFCENNTGYNVVVELWSLYGNYNVRIDFYTEKKFSTMGKDLNKCLAQCLEFLKKQ